MAYFANGTEGMAFDEECSTCKYGEIECPIAWVQMNYNYEACNIPVARAILDDLVADDGKCAMKAFLEKNKDYNENQLSLFD